MSVIEVSGSHAALAPRERYLPRTQPDGFVIGDGEPIAIALQRVTTEQFTIAINALSDPHPEIGAATHAALTSLARIAAVLRLVRRAIGDDAYTTEITVLREARDLLTDLVAGQAEIHALDQLRARYESILRPQAFSELRDQLLHRYQVQRLQQLPAVQEGGALEVSLQQLRRARARFAAWPVDRPLYGRDPVPDSFDAVSPGLERTYRKGRKHWESAGGARDEASDTTLLENPAKWLRSSRELAHQVELLGSGWPEVVAATARASARLNAVLDEEREVAALQAVVTDGHVVVGPVEQALLESVCEHERRECAAIAARLGARIYVEAPDQFVFRIGCYWNTRG